MSSLPHFAPANSSAQCKRIRKREMDRICQQRKRRRDRENLQKLEERLQLLQDDKQDSLLAQLLKDRDDEVERNIRHRTRLLQIKGLIQADLADLGHTEVSKSPDCDGNSLQTLLTIELDSPSTSESALLDSTFAECTDETSPLGCGDDLDAVDAFNVDDFGGRELEADVLLWPQQAIQIVPDHVNSMLMVPETLANTNKNNDDNGGRQRKLWEEVEQLITRAKPALSCLGTANSELDMHIIINAVSRGWSQFSQVVRVDARWGCLRELDEKYFSRSYGPVERLAVLTIASQLMEGDMMGNSVTSKLLPQFVIPRPSQLAIPHSVIADFYVWPGFRERLTICQHYYSDSFLHAMHMMFRFIWPYDLKATYHINPQTGLSQFSPRFLEHLQDIRCWTMNSDFLVTYPDFRGEVPVWNAGPSGLLSTAVTYAEWYHFNNLDEEESSSTSLQPATALGF